ncbi:MAG TPA: hypothetical protein VLF93_01600 [Candidatus Saccharimonadales bacterium]|nr:hypothetical protein [Candidatus Saccharimonadales bacterium]
MNPEQSNQETQLPQPNKYIEFFKNNKRNLYIIGAICLIFILSFGMIFLTINLKSSSPTNTTSSNNQTSNPTISTSISPSQISVQITTPNPTEAATIQNQVQPQVTPAVAYTYSEFKKFGDNWATVVVTNPDITGGGIIMKKVNGTWKIIEGPGSFFPPDLLQSIGAPQQLIDSFNPQVSPSGSDSNDIQ